MCMHYVKYIGTVSALLHYNIWIDCTPYENCNWMHIFWSKVQILGNFLEKVHKFVIATDANKRLTNDTAEDIIHCVWISIHWIHPALLSIFLAKKTIFLEKYLKPLESMRSTFHRLNGNFLVFSTLDLTFLTFYTIMVRLVAKVGRKIEFIAGWKVVFPDVLSGGSQSGFSVVTQ